MEEILPGMLVIATGVVTVLGALMNWPIVTGSNKLLPRLLGPSLARPVMAGLGLLLIGFGLALVVGWV